METKKFTGIYLIITDYEKCVKLCNEAREKNIETYDVVVELDGKKYEKSFDEFMDFLTNKHSQARV